MAVAQVKATVEEVDGEWPFYWLPEPQWPTPPPTPPLPLPWRAQVPRPPVGPPPLAMLLPWRRRQQQEVQEKEQQEVQERDVQEEEKQKVHEQEVQPKEEPADTDIESSDAEGDVVDEHDLVTYLLEESRQSSSTRRTTDDITKKEMKDEIDSQVDSDDYDDYDDGYLLASLAAVLGAG